MSQRKVLLVDLNNFARYPTISVGLLASVLRRESFDVDVFSPLSTGVTGVRREKPVPGWGLFVDRMKFRTAMTKSRLVRNVRNALRKTSLHAPKLARQSEKVAGEIAECLDSGEYDAVLVSSYLMYHQLCTKLAGLCDDRDIPMLLGGPYFAQPEVRAEWMGMRGLSGLVGGEVELYLAELVHAMIARESLDRFPWRLVGRPSSAECTTSSGSGCSPVPRLWRFSLGKVP